MVGYDPKQTIRQLQITIKGLFFDNMFSGHVNGNDTEVTGKVEIPNFSEEHTDMKDVDVDVQLTTKVGFRIV